MPLPKGPYTYELIRDSWGTAGQFNFPVDFFFNGLDQFDNGDECA